MWQSCHLSAVLQVQYAFYQALPVQERNNMKRMLINATQLEELRVALVEGQKLYDLDIEHTSRRQEKANIYKGRITRVEPSLEAAFVEYGADRHGFLSLKEISRDYFLKSPGDMEGRMNIKELIREGQEVIIQIDKEERGNKGAALTTFISLAGRYLVLMPNNPRAGGISRRIEGEERDELKDALSSLQLPSGMGVIIRTAGLGRNAEELQWDLDYLLQLWGSIKTEADNSAAPHFLFQESNVVIRAIRDYLRQDIGEVIIDERNAYELASAFIQQVMPNYKSKVKFYQDTIPLFTRYQIEGQIESAFEREVKLPSGGAIVIDVTEALVSIDINSSRATKGGDIEETATNTNLEAADEIARQLRLRDIGGLVVIDFIDMNSARNQRQVEDRVRDALQMDRARVQVGRISRFGLLEMSRQRLRPSLAETSGHVCPRCSGQGTIRGTKSIALAILRVLEESAQKERSSEIRAITPVAVASFLLNEKRKQISEIEQRHSCRVVIVPNSDLVTPHYEVKRLRDDDSALSQVSFEIEPSDDVVLNTDEPAQDSSAAPKVAAVQLLAPKTPPPASTRNELNQATDAASGTAPAPGQKAPNVISRLLNRLFGDNKAAEAAASTSETTSTESTTTAERPRNDRNRGGDSRRRDGGRSNGRNRGRGDRTEPRGERREPAPRDAQQTREPREPREGQREQAPRQQRPPRGEQQPREQRPPRPQAQPQTSSETNELDSSVSPVQRPNNKRPRNEQRRRQRPDIDLVTASADSVLPAATDSPIQPVPAIAVASTAPAPQPQSSPATVTAESAVPTQAPAARPTTAIVVDAVKADTVAAKPESTQVNAPVAANTPAAIKPPAAPTASVSAETTVTVTTTAVTPTSGETKPARRSRPVNDPRLQGQQAPRQFEILTEIVDIPARVPMETVIPAPQATQRRRPPNDPRAKREPVAPPAVNETPAASTADSGEH
jgi:ribonuclease E